MSSSIETNKLAARGLFFSPEALSQWIPQIPNMESWIASWSRDVCDAQGELNKQYCLLDHNQLPAPAYQIPEMGYKEICKISPVLATHLRQISQRQREQGSAVQTAQIFLSQVFREGETEAELCDAPLHPIYAGLVQWSGSRKSGRGVTAQLMFEGLSQDRVGRMSYVELISKVSGIPKFKGIPRMGGIRNYDLIYLSTRHSDDGSLRWRPARYFTYSRGRDGIIQSSYGLSDTAASFSTNEEQSFVTDDNPNQTVSLIRYPVDCFDKSAFFEEFIQSQLLKFHRSDKLDEYQEGELPMCTVQGSEGLEQTEVDLNAVANEQGVTHMHLLIPSSIVF